MMQKEKVRKSETKRINIVMDGLCPQWKVQPYIFTIQNYIVQQIFFFEMYPTTN